MVVAIGFEIVDFNGYKPCSTGRQGSFQIMQVDIKVIDTKLSEIGAVLEIRKPFPKRVPNAKSADVMLE